MPSLQEVEHALAAILASPHFRNSVQCSGFLKYVVKHSLSGEDHLLRERVIGHEVFHRAPDYETGEDPVVRIRAAEVRKRLAQYYQNATSEVHIEVPSGSYRAVFHVREAPPSLPAPATSPQVPPLLSLASSAATVEAASPAPFPAVTPEAAHEQTTAPAHLPEHAQTGAAARPWKQWLALVATSAVLASGATYLATAHAPKAERAEKQFWGPWVDPHRPVLIATGSNAVYRLNDQVVEQYAHSHSPQPQGLEVFPPPQDIAALHGNSFTPAENSFVALGDVAAVADLVAVLARNGQHFEQRFPNDISFAELRGSPTILVGGYNNPTSAELTKNMRFRLTGHNEIDDTQTPGRKWELHASLDSHETEDYAILTRTLQQGTDAPLLSVAGMGQYGTQAAAEFIASPALISELSQRLGDTWQQKNLQLVLHVRIRDFKPSRPEIVASYSW